MKTMSIRTAKQLVEAGFIPSEKKTSIEKVAENFSIALTPQIVELLQSDGLTEFDKKAIAKQYVPDEQELTIADEELKDPIGDDNHTVVKGLMHRYPDRCLLMPITVCPVYCRFCFRREKVGPGQKALSEEELNAAFEYIAAKKEIWEVILTGGDPFMLNPKQLGKILQRLEMIEHVEVIRIHTKIPLIDSKRITPELIHALKIKKAVYVALHCNHPAEFTETVKTTCAQIIDAGIPMLSQTVLLKGVNDTPEVMGELMRTFVKNRIKPYYLHHGDLAEGTSHFRTTLEEGQALMKALQGRYSGLCLPTYVLDIPDGYGKAPINGSYVTSKKVCDKTCYQVEDYQGNLHSYP